MNLFTEDQFEKLLQNGGIAARERAGEVAEDMSRQPVVKLFTPWGAATWLISEIDPEDKNIAFGLCDLGMGCPELGSVYIPELVAVRGPFGLRIERDLYWTPSKPLVDYAREARHHGAIQA